MKITRSTIWTLLLWLAFLGWGVVLWFLSSIPGDRMPPVNFPNADKVAHFTYFFIGGAILSASLHRTFGLGKGILCIVVLVILSQVGASDEHHQLSTPHRSGNDRGDWLADCAGAGVGALVIALFYARRSEDHD